MFVNSRNITAGIEEDSGLDDAPTHSHVQIISNSEQTFVSHTDNNRPFNIVHLRAWTWPSVR